MEPLLEAKGGILVKAETTAKSYSFLALEPKIHRTKDSVYKTGRFDLRLLLKLRFTWKMSKIILINTSQGFESKTQLGL